MIRPVKVTQQTINDIFSQLSEPNVGVKGEKRQGNVRGQIEKPNDWGGNSYTPANFTYTAEINEVDESLEWKITSIKIVGSESIGLTW